MVSRNGYNMAMAELASERSTCNVKVGAVAVKEGRVIMTAYNGAPSGMKHCVDVGCNKIMTSAKVPISLNGAKFGFADEISSLHCNRTIHAEQNIITQCAKRGVNLSEAIIYSTHQPCFECVKLLYASGVKKIIYKTSYADDRYIAEYDRLNLVESYAKENIQ